MSYRFGIHGIIASGKSFVAQKLASVFAEHHQPLVIIDVDQIRRDICGASQNIEHIQCRHEIRKALELEPTSDQRLDGRLVGEKIFFSDIFMERYRSLLLPVLRRELIRQLQTFTGNILLEWALLREDGLLDLVNYQSVQCICEPDVRMRRLHASDLPQEQLMHRINFQIRQMESYKTRPAERLICFDTSRQEDFHDLYEQILKNFIQTC
ncbi:MAG TPA: dephospho-CoA kinase [Patescibacteria group bacterium]|nr:dephospho-CoA kinase [Patescibacteria group bacterium]